MGKSVEGLWLHLEGCRYWNLGIFSLSSSALRPAWQDHRQAFQMRNPSAPAYAENGE